MNSSKDNITKQILDRRDFLKLGLLSTALSVSGLAVSASEKQIQPPLQKYVAKKYTHLLNGALNGISNEQLNAHFGLYENYINKINDLEARIKGFNTNNVDTINYRGWHLAQTSMLNGAVLHELYFGNLGVKDKEPRGVLKKLIERDFGNLQNFVGHLKVVGKVMHGWSIAAYNYRTGRINIYGLESHNQTVPTMVYPILVLDVYEHAYMIDYETDRKKYLDVFVANLNWIAVEERLEKALLIKFGEAVTV